MNERIKELWNKAAESTAAFPSGQNNSWETQVNFVQKFAELIIEECISACATDRLGKTVSAEELIKEHFGVKE